jgi:predicted nucleic acid-binding Zn ribbon protein
MVRLAQTLDRVLAGLGAPPATTLEVVTRAWPELVGPAAAAALQPTVIRDGVLVVQATEPVWAGQARWLEAAVVEGLAPLLGPGVVTALTARTAPSGPPRRP